MEYHVSVLREQAIELLSIQKDGVYVDATLGGGGHFIAIADALENMGGGVLVGIDVDHNALEHVAGILQEKRYKHVKTILLNGNFSTIRSLLIKENIKTVRGVLYDFGVSSYQIDTPQRGFSYMKEGPLDMRMDEGLGVKAEDLINGLYEKELEKLFWEYGEERYARRIAKAIVVARRKAPLKTTKQLAEVIKRSVPMRNQIGSHPAKRVFQALRIAINSELESIAISLPQAFEMLALQGRICTISFHSLEDRIVKEFFKEKTGMGQAIDIVGGVLIPSDTEIEQNKRAKSAKLRSIEKIHEYGNEHASNRTNSYV